MTGNSPRSRLVLVFHFSDLERLGLVDSDTGEALLRAGGRLAAIRELRTGTLIQAVRTPPGLYLIEAQPTGGRRAQPSASGWPSCLEGLRNTVTHGLQ